MNDDLEDAVERIETAILDATQSIETAIRKNSTSAALSGAWTAFLVGACLFVAAEVWHSKWRYELQFDVLSSAIHSEKEPHDCDFFSAPLGEKYCHYDRRVSTIRWATSTAGLPIASVDDGKTWNAFTPEAGVTVPINNTVEEVYLSWEKKED